MTRVKKKFDRMAARYPVPVRGEGPLATEDQLARLEHYRRTTYVSKAISAALRTGMRNGSITFLEADQYLVIFRKVIAARSLRRLRSESGSGTVRSS